MTRTIKMWWAAVLLAAFSLPLAPSAIAQVHGVSVGRPSGSIPMRASGIRPAQLVGTPLHPNFGPIARVPGLGFDVRSLASRGRPALGRRPRRDQAVTPFLWYSPFYSPYVDYGSPYTESYDAPPPPYDDQQPTQPTAPAVAPQPQFEPSESSSVSAELQPPPPEVGQFILVRLDGQVVFAVAFTAVDGRLTYVTREGLRRSFPVTELDEQATRQMNDANGTSVSLPD